LGRKNGADGVRFKPGRFDKTTEGAVAGRTVDQLVEQWKPANTPWHHTGEPYHDFHCPFLWGHATVHSDGGIGACCETHLKQHDGGNLAAGKFLAQWHGKSFQRMRRVAVGRSMDDADADTPCATCTMFAKPFAEADVQRPAGH